LDRRSLLKLGVGAAAVAGLNGSHGAIEQAPIEVVPASERADVLAQLRPPKRTRPVVAILAENSGTETTDLVVPWSVLKRSGAADVTIVATRSGPVALHPALSIQADHTTASFDQQHAGGPDYVIVPALHRRDDRAAVDWLRAMASGGATVVAICAGALTVGHAGLLKDKRAVTHWYNASELKRISPSLRWQTNRRYVADTGVITSTGVSASLPVSLTLVEAIAGLEAANGLAAALGIDNFDSSHNSKQFVASADFYARAALNTVNVFSHETLAIEIADGVDELALALTADAWSRTYRSKAVAVATGNKVRSKNGLEFRTTVVDPKAYSAQLSLPNAARPADLASILDGIKGRYGASTAKFVAMQLEFPWRG
jgi:transcriptional regulator GlxA family with amidase domain